MNMLVSRIGFSRVAAHAGLAAALLLLASCGDSGNNSGRPSLASESISRTFAAGRQIEAVRFANSGGSVSRCLVSLALPAGLNIAPSSDGTSCELSGTPQAITPVPDGVTTYTVTAYNSNGTALTDVRISFRVNEPGILSITVYGSSGTAYAVAVARGARPILIDSYIKEAANTQGNDGTIAAASRAIGVVAAGKKDIDVANGKATVVLTGVLVDRVRYDIYTVVQLSSGVFDKINKIDYEPDDTATAAAPNLANAAAQTLTVGTRASIPFTNSGGSIPAGGCAVSPALPMGLSIDRTSSGATCEITGTPTAMAAQATYTVTATNATGADSTPATVSIAINNAAPPPAAAVPSLANAAAATLTENSTAGLPIRFTNSGGGALTSCTVSNPALPAGLMARPHHRQDASCEITGTPTAMTARATYTMTARNAAGTGTATVSITIDAAPPPATAKPILANVTTAQNLTLGAPAPTITFTNTGGGSLTSCTVSNPALPSRPDGQARHRPDALRDHRHPHRRRDPGDLHDDSPQRRRQ